MRRLNQSILSAISLGLTLIGLGGCLSIPDGEPPAGPVVLPNVQPETLHPTGAVNRFATSLTAELLRRYTPGSEMLCRRDFEADDPATAAWPDRVLRQSSDLFRFRFDAKAELALRSVIRRGNTPGEYRWEMILSQNGQMIWRDGTTVKVPLPEPRTINQTD